MSRRKKRKLETHGGMGPVPRWRRWLLLRGLFFAGALCALVLGICFVLFSDDGPGNSPNDHSGSAPPTPATTRSARSLDDLLRMTPEQLARVDVAEANLLCAMGLPGAEELDIDRCLATLDRWAARVESEVARHAYKFHAKPIEYGNSPGYFRMLMLITVVQQDFGVHYNLDRVREIDFTRSQDLFLHGMIGSDNGGTCVSMPVLYAAVARRLGWPVRLVLAKAHVFCRWDGPNERFNVEGTNRGLATYADDYYKTWPLPINDEEAAAGYYLESLSPSEELACFLASRGHCLLDTGRSSEAHEAYAAAHRFSPENPAYLACTEATGERSPTPTYVATMAVARSSPHTSAGGRSSTTHPMAGTAGPTFFASPGPYGPPFDREPVRSTEPMSVPSPGQYP